MKDYRNLLENIIANGHRKNDRTGTGTLSLHGGTVRFDMRDGFPLLTLKKTRFDWIAMETLWFISGSTDVSVLHKQGCPIWDPWVLDDGTIGDGYGKQLRRWEGRHGTVVDQILESEYLLNKDPYSRRNIVTMWQPAELDDMALPPCHHKYQLLAYDIGQPTATLDLIMDIRSWDTSVGGPYNIASYSLFLHMYAAISGLRPGELVIHYGDAHIYVDQLDKVREMLSREDKPLPTLKIKDRGQQSITQFELEDFELQGYDPHPFIKLPVAV